MRISRSVRAVSAFLLLAAALPAAAAAGDASLGRSLSRAMHHASAASGAYVYNATTGKRVFMRRANKARILASNTKLFTTSTALTRYGPDGTLGTEVRGNGTLGTDGVYNGNLYLVGGGDPTFGSNRFVRHAYGSGTATVEQLESLLATAGIEKVTGRVYGDESHFDSLRGGPDSGYGTSLYVGPLSALDYNRGLANEGGSAFQNNPPLFAARTLARLLEKKGIDVGKATKTGRAPADAKVLASVDSAPMARLIRFTNKPSDNYLAEMLLKDVAYLATGRGTTKRGARQAMAFAKSVGSRARLVDGSGLARGNRATPYRVVRLLRAMRKRPEASPFNRSLSIAGRDGTLGNRMRSGAARGRCRGKTGTLSNVSALSGYCRARSGDVYVFSLLMNRTGITNAHQVQDRMANLMAAVR